MAFIDNQDPNQDPNNPQNQAQPGQAPATGGQGSQVAGGSQGSSSAGVGPGGTGGWTNIQAYLGANQGDTGSAGALNKTVGDQFSNERTNMQNDAQKYLGDAQNQAKSNEISNDQADQYTTQAGNEYQYAGGNNPVAGYPVDGGIRSRVQMPGGLNGPPQDPAAAADYSSVVDKFHHALNDQYGGPTSYNYGISADTQNRGAQLKDNGQFDTLMNNIYSNSAQKPLTSGQFQLQKQLDVGNQGLQDARQNLSGQYDSLLSDRDKAVGDTTTALGGIAQDYGKSQNALRDYLSGKEPDLDSKIGTEQAAAKTAYQNSYNNDPLSFGAGSAFTGYSAGRLQNYLNGSGMAQLYAADPTNPAFTGANAEFGTFQPKLDAFNAGQNGKYSNTGDQEKRQYNAIQDFLGLTGNDKQQGFKVSQ